MIRRPGLMQDWSLGVQVGTPNLTQPAFKTCSPPTVLLVPSQSRLKWGAHISKVRASPLLIVSGSFLLVSKEIHFEEDFSSPGGLFQKNSVAYKVVCYFAVILYTMEG